MATSHESPEHWLDQHGNALYSFALTRLRDPHKAEEAVQETLVAALTAHERFSGGASVRTWLIGILKHKIMDQFRHDARVQPFLDETELTVPEDPIDDQFLPNGHWVSRLSDWGNPESSLEQSQFWDVLQSCLDALPERLARLFILREVMEEDTASVCQELAITPTNLWTMLYRARMGLRRCLDQNWGVTAQG